MHQICNKKIIGKVAHSQKPNKQTHMKLSTLVCILLLTGMIISSCASRHPIVGKWRTDSPANLLFMYADDGTVSLLEGGDTLQVFHYEIIGDDAIRLIDGMGRMQAHKFSIVSDTMTFYDSQDTGKIVGKFTREK